MWRCSVIFRIGLPPIINMVVRGSPPRRDMEDPQRRDRKAVKGCGVYGATCVALDRFYGP